MLALATALAATGYLFPATGTEKLVSTTGSEFESEDPLPLGGPSGDEHL